MDPNSQPLISTPENLYQSAPEQQSSNLSSGKSGSSKLLLFGLLSILIIAGLVGTGYFLGANKSATVFSHSQMAKTSPSPTPNPTANWSTYTDSDNRFSFKYPSDWQTVVVSHSNNVVVTTADIAQQLKSQLVSGRLGGCMPFYPIFITDITNLPTLQTPNPGTSYTQTALTVNGMAVTLYTVTNTPMDKSCSFIGDTSAFVVLNRNNHLFRIELRDATNKDDMTVFRELITTFEPSNATPTTAPTPTPVEKSTYKDSYLNYSITYPKTWAFRRTYGPDIQKLAPTDIVSGFDLTYNLYVGTTPYTQATVVVNVLDAHGLTDVQTWIDKYDPNYPKSGGKYQTTYNNTYPAVAWTDEESDKDYEYLYFIAGNYMYRINGSEIKGFSEDKDFHDILSALKP